MDDISREPLPESTRGRGTRTKGPAELLRMEEALQDDADASSLRSEVRVVPLSDESDPTDADGAEIEAERAAEEMEATESASGEASVEDASDAGTSSGDLSFEDHEAADETATAVEDAQAGDEEASGGEDVPTVAEAVVASDAGTVDVASPETVSPETATSRSAPAALPRATPTGESGEDAAELFDPAEIAKVALAVLLTQKDGLTAARLAEVCNAGSKKHLEAGLDHLAEFLIDTGMPVELGRTGDVVRLLTTPGVFPYLRRLKQQKAVEKISPAALETLAVVAYKQPVIRAEIESIRGVKVGPVLRWLLEHKLIDVVGRADVPGKPLQYGTTKTFLERFGLSGLAELPSVQEFQTLQ